MKEFKQIRFGEGGGGEEEGGCNCGPQLAALQAQIDELKAKIEFLEGWVNWCRGESYQHSTRIKNLEIEAEVNV